MTEGAYDAGAMPPTGQQPSNLPATGPGSGAAPKTSSAAVLSLVMGLISIVACPLTGIVGLIAGFSARRRIRESNGAESGDGLAIAGIITSLIGLIVVGVAVLAILAVTLLGTSASSKFSSVS